MLTFLRLNLLFSLIPFLFFKNFIKNQLVKEMVYSSFDLIK